MARSKTHTVRPPELLPVSPSPLARRLLWHLFSLDTSCVEKPEHHESFEKPGVHLFWVLSGKGIMETQGHQYELRPGNCVWFVDMMYPRMYSPAPGEKIVKRGFRFGGPGLERWHEEFGGSKRAEFILEDVSTILYTYREISQILKRKATGWEWQVHMILTRILGFLLSSRNLLSSGRLELPPAIIRVLNALAANPFYDWKVTDLVSIAGVSYSGLRSTFYKAHHQSLHHFLQRNRLDQARLLLSDTRLSVKQIAAQMHFSSEFYFSHFFKKMGGMSPSEFRNRLKAKKINLRNSDP
jgi:AraC-like DNA-binding protein